MADDLHTQIKISANADGVEAGVTRAKRSIASLAQGTKDAAGQAGDGLRKFGDNADQANQQVGRSMSSVLASIRRTQTETQRLLVESQGYSRGSADAIEELARMRGQDVSAIQGQLAALRQLRSEYDSVQALQREAAASALFEAQHAEARKLVQDAEYVRFWTASLAEKEAAERQQADLELFEREHQAAKQLVRDAEYVRMWSDALDAKERAERKAASQNAFIDSLREESAAIGKTRADLLEMQAAKMGVADRAAPFIAQMRASEKQVNSFGETVRQARFHLLALAGGFTFVGALRQLVSVQREFDVLNSSLRTVTGSSQAAEFAMAWLQDFAKETPFGLAQATEGFVKMKALGLDPTRAALTSFGNTASAMGKDLNQMIEAVADASTGEFERLKEFGITAKREGDKVALTFQGVTTTVRNNAREITKYLQDIGNTQFAGAMEERARTLDGAISELGDTWDDLFRTISRSGVGSLIYDSVKLATSAIQDASVVYRALIGTTADVTRETGALVAVQASLATAFETIAVLGANVRYVLMQTGDTMGGLAALYKEFFSFNMDGARAVAAQMVENGRAARAEIDATERRIMGARKAQDEYREWATRNASAATDPRRLDAGGGAIGGGGGADAAAAKDAVDARLQEIRRGLEIEVAITRSALEDIASLRRTLQISEREQIDQVAMVELGALERRRRALLEELGVQSTQKNSLKEVAALRGQLALVDLEIGDRQKKQLREINELTFRQAQAVQAVIDAQRQEEADDWQAYDRQRQEAWNAALISANAYGRQIDEANEATAYELSLMGRGSRERAIAIEQYRVQVRLKERLRVIESTISDAEEQRALRAIEEATAAREAAGVSQRVLLEESRRTADSIEQMLSDALMRGFEDGKGFAQNLRDTLKNMFSTLVLRPVISAVMTPVASALTGALGTGSVSGGVGGVLGSFNPIPSMLGNLLGGGGTFGMGLNAGFSALLGEAGLSGAMSAGFTALGAGNIMGGLGTIAGALGPIAMGIGAVAALIKNFDDSGTLHTGSKVQYSASGGLQQSLERPDYGINIGMVYGAQTHEVVAGIAKGLVNTFDGLARAFGGQGGYEVATGYADDTSKDGAWGALRVSQGGREVLNWDDTQRSRWAPKIFSDGEKGYKEYLEAIAASTKQVLKGMDLPGWAQAMVDALGATPGMDELATVVAQIEAGAKALGIIGSRIQHFSAFSDTTVSALIAAAGSVDTLATALGGYYENYYTQAERTAALTGEVSRALSGLGLTMPSLSQGAEAARAQFRAMLEGIDASTERGRQQYLGLLALQGAFAELTPLMDNTAAATQAAAAALREREQLEMQLLQLQGDTDEIRRRTLAALLDEQNRAIQQSIFDLQDKQAADAAAKAATDAAAQVKAAWQSVGDSIVEEIQRIRGLAGGGAATFAQAQAEFALATAAARAGDKDAAASLAGLSRTVLELVEQTATSALELRTFQGQVAASLAETAQALAATRGVVLPAFAGGGAHAGGWALVGERGPELAYMPPAHIYTASQSASMLGDTQSLRDEVRQLREDLRQVGASLASLQLRNARAVEASQRLLEDVTEGGAAMRAREVMP